MDLTPLGLRPELDELWPRLRNEERARVSAWCEIARRMCAAADKTGELALVLRQFAAVVPHISRNTVYRKIGGIRARGPVEGVLGKAAADRARGVSRGASLPPGFVSHWRSLCGDMQRGKTLAAWRRLMGELAGGRVMPGYGKDWRGIWLDEHPGEALPADARGRALCPYTAVHAGPGACAPRGWGYASLLALAPEPDVRAGAHQGAGAMSAHAPLVPHTRVGLAPMRVVTMDDVRLDQFCWVAGEREPRRPVGLGVMDVATGCVVDWTLVPALEREDGTVSGLAAGWARYVWANVFCGIGVDPRGVVALLEHGSAGLDKDEERRINGILGPRPDGGAWLTVRRSSTTGAPILRGLYAERARGRPTHKAMLEATWNLLHNEMAHLPAPSGKDWDAAPQDREGWTREDRALIEAGARALASGCPEAVEALRRAQTTALSYDQLAEASRAVVDALNHRRDHRIQDWEACGFVTSVVPFGGQLLPLGRVLDEASGGDPALREALRARLAPRQQALRMSPAEAWASFDPKARRVFPPFVATQILGDGLSQEAEVDARRQFAAEDPFSGKRMLFAANVRRGDGAVETLAPGTRLRVWVNPIRSDWALVSRPGGEFLGAARYMAPTVFGDSSARGNLAELAQARADQRRRLASAVGGKRARAAERRASNARALAAAAAAPEEAAERQCRELAAAGADDVAEVRQGF